jgi:hypothetical protein
MQISLRCGKLTWQPNDSWLEHFQAKPALGLDPGVDTGSPSESATTQREKSEARFYQNGIRSKAFSNKLASDLIRGRTCFAVDNATAP